MNATVHDQCDHNDQRDADFFNETLIPLKRRRFDLAATELNNTQLAHATGYSIRSICRWRNSGVTVWVADHIATALGYYPTAIWPDWATDWVTPNHLSGRK